MKKYLFTILACSLFLNTVSASAQVPDYSSVVVEQFGRTTQNVRTQEGAGKFTEEVASLLYQRDQNFGHLRKSTNRTHCGNPPHACDVVLYKATGQIVDILRDGGGPDAAPTWRVGPFGEYQQRDWMGPEIVTPEILPGIGLPGPAPVIPSTDFAPVLNYLATIAQSISDRDERIFANLTAQIQALTERANAIEQRLIQHDTEPGWLKKFMGNRYVQLLGAGLIARFGLPTLAGGDEQ